MCRKRPVADSTVSRRARARPPRPAAGGSRAGRCRRGGRRRPRPAGRDRAARSSVARRAADGRRPGEGGADARGGAEELAPAPRAAMGHGRLRGAKPGKISRSGAGRTGRNRTWNPKGWVRGEVAAPVGGDSGAAAGRPPPASSRGPAAPAPRARQARGSGRRPARYGARHREVRAHRVALVLAGPVVDAVDQQDRHRDPPVLGAGRPPSCPMAHKRGEAARVPRAVAHAIDLPRQRGGSGARRRIPPLQHAAHHGYDRSRLTVAPSTGTSFRPKNRLARAELRRRPGRRRSRRVDRHHARDGADGGAPRAAGRCSHRSIHRHDVAPEPQGGSSAAATVVTKKSAV